MTDLRTSPIVCSFCGEQRGRGAVVAGQNWIFVCQECASLADDAVREGTVRVPSGRELLSLRSELRAYCGFCGKERAAVDVMIEAPAARSRGVNADLRPGVRVCGECLDLCREIWAEQAGVP